MTLFRLVLAVVWLTVVIITVQAALSHGIGSAAEVFSADLQAVDWRSQFTADLLAQLLLIGIWVAWRHTFSPLGIFLGLSCVMGGLFTVIYVLVLSVYHRGNAQAILLGKQAKL